MAGPANRQSSLQLETFSAHPRRSALLLSVLLTAAMAMVSARCPQALAAAGDALSLRIVAFSAWNAPDSNLSFSVEIVNRGPRAIGDLSLRLSIFDATSSRSDLRSSLAGRLPALFSLDTIPVEGNIAAGATKRVTADKPLSEVPGILSGKYRDGAYPVQVSLRTGRKSPSLATIATQMVLISKPPPVPLRFAFVIPLSIPPSIPPSRPLSRPLDSRGLDSGTPRKTASAGVERVQKILAVLRARPAMPVALAVDGLVVDHLAARNNPATRLAIDSLKASGSPEQRPADQLLSSPYAQASLPAMIASGQPRRAASHLLDTQRALKRLGHSDEGWFLPADGLIDEATLQRLATLGLTNVIVGPSSLRQNKELLTISEPVLLSTSRSPSLKALVSDDAIARLFESRSAESVIARQLVLAESITVHQEKPAKLRGFTMVAPDSISASSVATLLDALASAPWLKLQTPASLASEIPISRQRVAVQNLAANAALRPPSTTLDALRRSRASIGIYTELDPPAASSAVLRRRLSIAEGLAWSAGLTAQRAALQVAARINRDVESEAAKIRAPLPRSITLTSRDGRIPLSVTRRTTYPVKVTLRLRSQKLNFPTGSRFNLVLESRLTTVDIPATAEATGSFPVEVVLQTSGGRVLDRGNVIIRSTAFNILALRITAGAAIFLAAWWLMGFIGRRRHSPTRGFKHRARVAR